VKPARTGGRRRRRYEVGRTTARLRCDRGPAARRPR